ncbi:hypothetical protein DFH07DRAFT_775070 [Mycena maculata]|uniref:Uncharacterized protein n=1 Tax=Mycena maculata TaxID=230809 RepID=A0AAD7IUP8_9AGAR|nr:hypothetical protein DFH07DRAFT_775070 [Mycena maculata]
MIRCNSNNDLLDWSLQTSGRNGKVTRKTKEEKDASTYAVGIESRLVSIAPTQGRAQEAGLGLFISQRHGEAPEEGSQEFKRPGISGGGKMVHVRELPATKFEANSTQGFNFNAAHVPLSEMNRQGDEKPAWGRQFRVSRYTNAITELWRRMELEILDGAYASQTVWIVYYETNGPKIRKEDRILGEAEGISNKFTASHRYEYGCCNHACLRNFLDLQYWCSVSIPDPPTAIYLK